MEYVKAETVAAIKADEFAHATIEATIAFIYGHFRDFARIDTRGRLLFTSDDAATGYLALCALVGRTEPPVITGRVDVGGGQTLPVQAVEALALAFRKPAEAKGQ